VDHRFGGGTKIGASLFHAEGEVGFDGNFQNDTDFIQQAFGAQLTTSPADKWTAKLQAGRSRDDQDNFLDGVFSSNFDTTRDTASWQNDLTLSAQQLLTLGIDYQKDKISSNVNYAVNARDNTGYFAQYQETAGKHRFMLGIRQDDNQQFDKHTTGDAAWGYSINENLSYTLSYGTAFKAPTFNELYFPNFGDPNLEPEESQSVETAIKGRQSWGKWDIRAYQTSIDDLIATVCNPVTFLCNAANVDEARIHGMEATVTATVSGWTTAFYLTLLDPRDKDSDKVLPRRAKQTLKFDADRSIGKWQIGASLLAQSQRFDDVNNDIRVGGYGLVNLRAQYEPAKHWFLRATLDNLFDKAYQTVKTYNSARRAIFLSVGYRAQDS
jgi:vitamin B12 transporter